MRIPNVEISSSELRARVRRGAPIDFLVPAPVVAYIREHGLYAGEPERRPGAEAAAGA
jgi:nicotinate-nucleotide adenylyltransferase